MIYHVLNLSCLMVVSWMQMFINFTASWGRFITLFTVKETYGFLQYIDEDHVDFLSLCDQVEEIVKVNWSGVNVYLKPIYKYYYCLFQKMIMPIVEKIYTEPTLPELLVRKRCICMCVCLPVCLRVLHPCWYTILTMPSGVALRLALKWI